MADDFALIKDCFARAKVTLYKDEVWAVQGKPVVHHSALEKLAAAIGVKWELPVVLRNTTDDVAMIISARLGDGSYEWATGEAKIVEMLDTGRKNQKNKPIYEAAPGAIGNYQITPRQSAYPWAMAEKRGKDRVIIKLAGLNGAYSEEEADDFDRPQPQPPAQTAEPVANTNQSGGGFDLETGEIMEPTGERYPDMDEAPPAPAPVPSLAALEYVKRCEGLMMTKKTVSDLNAWWASEVEARCRHDFFDGPQDPLFKQLAAAYTARRAALKK